MRAAEKMFAGKGFDGARVEEIARESCVNQAMIYYYFKSKEELFNAVIEARLEDARKFLSSMKKLKPAPEIMSRQVLDFALEQRDFLKILMLGTLTTGAKNHWIFRMLDFIPTDPPPAENLAGHKHDKLAWFFFAILPAAAYSIFHEQWSEYFGSDIDIDKGIFVRSLKASTTTLRNTVV